MKRMLLTLTALMLAGGCATFRKFFDEEPERKATRKNRTEAARPADKSSEDPLFELLYRKNDRPGYLDGSNLSSEERKLVNRSFGTPGPKRDSDADLVRQEWKERKSKQDDWVFGTKDGKLF